MNALGLAIFFFTLIFVGSLFYSVKSKKDTLFSYFINLEFEYVIAGAVIYYAGMLSGFPKSTVTISFLYLVLSAMGLIIGTHFSAKLMLTVPRNMFITSLLIYIIPLPLFYVILSFFNCPQPVMCSIIFNTLMPYSINLGARLFKIRREKIFLSSLISSLFPFFSLVFYTVASGLIDYRPVDFSITLFLSIIAAVIFAFYGNTNKRKVIHKVSIMFVLIIAGVAMYQGISPIVIGFLTGFFLADSDYGNIFHSISVDFERFFYIFFYVALGLFCAFAVKGVTMYSLLAAALMVCVLLLIRVLIANYLIDKFLPGKGESVHLVSVGILPVVLLLDYGTRLGFDALRNAVVIFVLVHVITEIISYVKLKNEKNNV
jgi:hypothetical protein